MPSRPLRARLSTRSTAPTAPRRVLVTGGASGLGLALVRAFVARGDEVLATDLQADRPDALPEAAAYLPLDVRSDDAWGAALAHVRETWGGLDLLVNNAGVAAGGRIDVATMDEWHWIVDINLLGVVRGCRTFTPLFKEQRHGHIVNTASLAGLVHAAGKKMVSGSKRSAEQVADIVVRGIDARRDVILTDRDGQIAWRAKRFARPAYTAVMKRAARRVAAGR